MNCLSCALIAGILLAPLAAAHGSPDATFDPLTVRFDGFLAADGSVANAPPAAAAIPFAAITPASPAVPLTFAIKAPVKFAPGGGFAVEIHARADAPVVARDADGNALEIAVEPGGTPMRVAFNDSVLKPGAVESASVTIQAPGSTSAKNDSITLKVTPLMPALAQGALSILVGGDTPSRMDMLAMRVPTPKDLELEDSDLTMFVLGQSDFAPSTPGAVVDAFSIAHAKVTPPPTLAYSANGTYVVLRGDESVSDAMSHAFPDRERRVAAAHAFSVNGVLARVHPGLGVVVPVTSAPVRVTCVANCPIDGFALTITANGTSASQGGHAPDVLIPPPRDTRGVPVSEDEPPTKATPGIAPAVVIAAILMLGLASRRR